MNTSTVVHLILRSPSAFGRKLGARIATAVWRVLLRSVGAGTVIQWGANFRDPTAVRLGAACYIWSGVAVTADSPGGRLVVGDRVEINWGVHLDMTGSLVIGSDTLISEGAYVYTHDHGLDPRSHPHSHDKEIGAGAWIGMRAVIMPGCHRIGTGAIVGACAVVTRDVPDYAIVAGNPARVIGHRRRSLPLAMSVGEP